MAQANRSRATIQSGEPARIGGGTRVRGRISGEGDLTVDGSVEGNIRLSGDLTISDEGTATSDVEAHNVSVGGNLEGDVEASGNVRFGAGSRVRGNVRGAAIVIDDGARFAGRVDCEFEMPAELTGQAGERSGRR
jgi:cytoskeletal protein CcmA (bactofilin family)